MQNGAAELAERIRDAYRRGDTSEAERLTEELAALDTSLKVVPIKPPLLKPGALSSIILAAVGGTAMVFLVHSCSGSNSSEKVPIEAVMRCQDVLRSKASHPSMVHFPITGHASTIDAHDSSYRVLQEFTAKNSFGLELSFEGICVFPPARSLGAPEVLIREANQ